MMSFPISNIHILQLCTQDTVVLRDISAGTRILHVVENNAGARSAQHAGHWPVGYLSVTSAEGAAGARAENGSAGGARPAGSVEPGGGGGLREGSAQGGAPVP